MRRTASCLLFAVSVLTQPARAADSERIAWLWDGAGLPVWSAPHAAVLVEHVHLGGAEVRTRPRLAAAALPGGTRITPVIHVEVSTVDPPQPDAAGRDAIVQAVLRWAPRSTSGWIQLDMEARPSQRTFYLELVRTIRQQLPPQVKLSVTALAWWCRSPAWLDSLAADEVVPMAFRMGKDAAALRALWRDTPGRLHPRCRGTALGVATVEPLPAEVTRRYAKLYVFDRRGWRGAQERSVRP